MRRKANARSDSVAPMKRGRKGSSRLRELSHEPPIPRVNRISGITQHAEAPTAVSVPATSNQNPFLLAGVCSDIGSTSLARRRKPATFRSSWLAFGAFVILRQGFDALGKGCFKRRDFRLVKIRFRHR